MNRPSTNSRATEHRQRKLVAALLNWFSDQARDLPWRRTRDPYAIWVSEIMLQQTQVKTVIPYWERWMRVLPSIQTLAQARASTLLKLWEGLGYYTRVQHLQKAARIVVTRHGGQFPKTFEQVLALPGVGRYTAGAICSIAFNQPTPVLDGNVTRVLTRVFAIRQPPKQKPAQKQLWRLAESLVALASHMDMNEKYSLRAAPHVMRLRDARPWSLASHSKENSSTRLGACSALNQALMELGAVVCTPRQPRCVECPMRRHCVAYREDLVDKLPRPARRATPLSRRYAAFVFTRNDKMLVRQRPADAINARLWEFPNAEITDGDRGASRLAAQLVGPIHLEHVHQLRHSITRYRIQLDVFHAELKQNGNRSLAACKWKTPRQLNGLPFTAAHRKILDWLALHRPSTHSRLAN